MPPLASRSGSKNNLTDPFLFLPPDSVNQQEPPRLLLKVSSRGSSRTDLTDGGDEEKKKKLSTGTSAEEKTRREWELTELFKKLEDIKTLLCSVQTMAEAVLDKQTESPDFQKQMKKDSEGYDLQRGVYRILEACEGDRRELERLLRKATEMRKRQVQGVVLDGENEELRALILGAADLEKKLLKAVEELKRLDLKTDMVIARQKDLEEARRLKMLDAMGKNEALKALMKDSELLDKLLEELSEVKKEHVKSENLHRKINQLDPNNEEDEIDTDELILQRIGEETQTATNDILKTREAMQKLQDIMCFDPDPEVDLVVEAEALKESIEKLKNDVTHLWKDMDDFKTKQLDRYNMLVKSKMAGDDSFRLQMEEEERRQKEEEEKKRKEEEERKRREEEERRRREEEERLALEEERKRRAELERLEAEAERNRLAQIQEITTILEGSTGELEKMKGEVLILVDRQKKIGKTRRKRRELYTIPEEEDNEDEKELQEIISETSRLFALLMQNEKEVRRLKEDMGKNPAESLANASNLEKDLVEESKALEVIKENTEKCQFKHEKKLKELEKMQRDGAAQEEMDTKRNEILSIILGQSEKLGRLKESTLALKEAQVGVGQSLDERRQLFGMAPEEEEVAETELRELEKNTYDLFARLLKDSGELAEMQDGITTAQPLDMLERVERVEEELTRGAQDLHELQHETERLTEKHNKLIKEGLEAKAQGDEAAKAAEENAESLDRLKGEAENVAGRQDNMEKDLRRSSNDIEDEEKARRLAELEALMKQKDDLAAIERSLDETTKKMEEWQEFAWTEEDLAELQKYGMISSLANPSFPLHLIKDPELLAIIMKRRQEMLDLRIKLDYDKKRMEEICAAIEAMEERYRQAELKRLAAQKLEWTKDFIPEGAAEFGSMPSFR